MKNKVYRVRAAIHMTIEIDAHDEDDAVEKVREIPFSDWKVTDFDVYDAECIWQDAGDYFSQDDRISLAKDYA
jgi:hypothetical protein